MDSRVVLLLLSVFPFTHRTGGRATPGLLLPLNLAFYYPPFIASPFLLVVYLVPSHCGSRAPSGLSKGAGRRIAWNKTGIQAAALKGKGFTSPPLTPARLPRR